VNELAGLAETMLGRRLTHEALLGFSTGASTALAIAERVPERFAAVAVAGPDAISSDLLAGAVRLSGHSVLVRIGQSDPAVNAARTFAARCPTATLEVVRGCHDDGFWRASADELVGFAAKALFP